MKPMLLEIDADKVTGMMWRFACICLVQKPELKKEEVLVRVLECFNEEQAEDAKAFLQDAKHEFISDWKKLNNL
jgi:hypothetical protein